MTKHTRLGASLLFALSLAACGGNPAVGTYVLDTAAFRKSMTEKATSPEEKKAAEQMADMIVGKMKLEMSLKPDQTFSMEIEMPAKRTASGTWQVDGERITVKTLEENGKPKATPEERSGTIKDGVITLDLDGMMKATLKKK